MRHFALGSVLLASAQLALAVTHEVVVGGIGILKFEPPSVTANVGDDISFIFRQKNHSVTQSSLDNPCTRVTNGFDMGFLVPDNQTVFPRARLPVDRTTPIWAFCRPHCRSGMVFAVNPGPDFGAFLARATAATPASSLAVSSTSSSRPAATSPGTPSTGTTEHKVIVGGTSLTFNPSNITAQVGDTITFEFHQKNHTVTASSFEEPCRDLSGQAAFDSGFKPVAGGVTDYPTYSLQVKDTKPIWAYCKQGNHCRQGMVFSANAVESSSQNFATFQANARQSTTGTSSSASPSASSAWRPTVGSSMVLILCLSAAAFLL